MRLFYFPWLLCGFAGLLLFATATGSAQAQTFVTQSNAPLTGSGGQPYGMAAADVNGDGLPDALVANTYLGTLAVLVGDGTGNFALQPNSPIIGSNATPYCVAVADVNGDGKLDALTANYGTSTVGILLGNGAGSFALQANSPTTGTGSHPHYLVLADINGDGNIDALTANHGTGTLGVLLGNGTGSFALQANSPATGTGINNDGPRSLAVADVNNDGKLDVLAANSLTNTLGVLLGDGADGFTLVSANSTGIFPTSPYGVAVGDINGDGLPDAVTANFATSNVSVMLGNGSGSFTLQPISPPSSSYLGGQAADVKLADVNGDGNLDALTVNSNYGNNTVGVLLGNGLGSFALQANSPSTGAYGTPFCLAVTDVNGDGKPDVLSPNVAYSTLGILLNVATYPNPTLTGISTGIAAVGSTLTLTGTGLAAATQVNFIGATQTTIASKAATRLQVLVPMGTRPGPVTVSSPGGVSNAQFLTTVLATQSGAAGQAQIALYPNPLGAATTLVTLAATGLPPTTTRLEATLLDVLGRPVYSLVFRPEAGALHATLPTVGLACGVYGLRLSALDGQNHLVGTLPTQRLSVR